MNQLNIIVLILLFSISASQQPKSSNVNKLLDLEDGWVISTLDKEGFDQHRLEEKIGKIPFENPSLDGLVVERNRVDKQFIERDYYVDKGRTVSG